MAKRKGKVDVMSGFSKLVTKFNETENTETLSDISKAQSASRKHLVKLSDIVTENKYELYIRKHEDEEFKQLEEAISRDGKVRDPLTVIEKELGKYIVIDGHHRLEIAKRLLSLGRTEFENISIEVESFEDDEAIFMWMLRNQLGRRNLRDSERIEIALKLTAFMEAQAKRNQGSTKDNLPVFANLRKPEEEEQGEIKPINRTKEVARIAGTSERNVTKVKKILEKGDEALKEELRTGKKSIHKAHEELKKPLERPELKEFPKEKVGRKPSQTSTTHTEVENLFKELVKWKKGVLTDEEIKSICANAIGV